jgi:hypothetical protein
MIDSVKNYAMSYEFMSMLALFTFWQPMIVCLTVYAFRFIGAYKRDLAKCQDTNYSPELTVGVVIRYFIISVMPCVNLFALVFDCGSSVFKWLGEFFSVPLVRAKK